MAYYEKKIRRLLAMLKFIFDDVNELVVWLNQFSTEFDERPRVSAKFIGKEKIYEASVSL